MTAEDKVCAICGKSCAGQERVRDSKGRYAHKACAARKAKARKARAEAKAAEPIGLREPVGAAVAGASGSAGASWLEDAIAHQPVPCSACGRHIAPDAKLCIHCGVNLETGKATRTQILKPPKEKKSGGGLSLGGGDALSNPLVMLGVGFVGWVLLGALAFGGGPEMALVTILVAGLWGLIAWIMMISAAFSDGDSGWGWMGVGSVIPVIGGILGLIFALGYCTVVSERAAWKVHYWMAQLAGIVVALSLAGSLLSGESGGPGLTVQQIAEAADDSPDFLDVSPSAMEDMVLVRLASIELKDNAFGRGRSITTAEKALINDPDVQFRDFPERVQEKVSARYAAMNIYQRDRMYDIVFGDYKGYELRTWHGKAAQVSEHAYDDLDPDMRAARILVTMLDEAIGARHEGRRVSGVSEQELFALRLGNSPPDYPLDEVISAIEAWNAMGEEERDVIRSSVFWSWDDEPIVARTEDFPVWIERTRDAWAGAPAEPGSP